MKRSVDEEFFEEEELWTDWREDAGGIPAICLFCPFTTTKVKDASANTHKEFKDRITYYHRHSSPTESRVKTKQMMSTIVQFLITINAMSDAWNAKQRIFLAQDHD